MICDQLKTTEERIRSAENAFGRSPGSVRLLAVSKTKPVEDIRAAYDCGQRAFGENYVQELQDKAQQLAELDIEWHYIGPLQSNKTRIIAEHADWIHTIDRAKIARRLSEQRPPTLPLLNCCIQINSSGEQSKSGILPEEVLELAGEIAALPGLSLRGLMTIPAPSTDLQQQRAAFVPVREAFETLNRQGLELDTLSMGMTGDLEAAVAEGSTLVRIGTAIFGARNYPSKT